MSSRGATNAAFDASPRPERLGDFKVIGLGGVGGIVARYGALYLSALDCPTRMVLIDGDDFEPKNASRMLFATHGNKASVVCEDLCTAVDDSYLSMVAVEEYITSKNLPRLIREGDTVLLAVDNHATRKLVSDYARDQVSNICLISGGNEGAGKDSTGVVQRGTYGNVQIYLSQDGIDITPSLTQFHPEIENPADQLPNEVSCTEALISTPQILFANLAVASSMLNALWLHLCGALHYPELCFDIHDGRMQTMPLPSKLSVNKSA
jgi:molybdopterin/thiamine biosynthesis adenylyltransferase